MRWRRETGRKDSPGENDPQEEQKRNRKKEQAPLRQTLAGAYLFLILAVLPLYTQHGFTLIGEVKYLFFRNVSFLFLLLGLLAALAEREKGGSSSLTDRCAIGFGAASLLSAALSPYSATALWGFPGWHMGAVTQLLMVWGYFLISRWYERERWVERGILFSAFAVALLGLLNRYELDPFGFFDGMDWFSWNRRNLLSTVGNINWYCGCLCVTVPLLLACYWGMEGGGMGRFFAAVCAFVGTDALVLQGSASGGAALAVIYGVLFAGSLGDRERELRALELLAMLPAGCLLLTLQTRFLDQTILLPEGSGVLEVVMAPVWLPVLLVLLLAWGGLRYAVSRGLPWYYDGGKARKYLVLFIFLALGAAATLFLLCQRSEEFWRSLGAVSWLRFDDRWGGERGFLWRRTLEVFGSGGPVRLLFGVGPDCYAELMEQGAKLAILVSGQWEGAVFENAHNEWLTMLINEGLFGTVFYLGFLGSAFVRFFARCTGRREGASLQMAGAMALAAYGTHGTFSFQQVVSTPLLFLLIGVCEASCRREKIKTEQNAKEKANRNRSVKKQSRDGKQERKRKQWKIICGR